MWVVEVAPFDTIYSEHLTYVFADNGPYQVTLYTRNDCDTVSTTQQWAGHVGIDESNLENMITLSPNPATDVLKIQFEGLNTDDINVEMTNIQGQLVYSSQFMNVSGYATETVDVSSLKKGMYIVKFTTDDNIVAKRIIIQ